jgi:L-threonylcarbamoyladenylate synthase
MEILTKREVLMRKKELFRKIKEGAIFIYPTDTIYGIGCNAQDENAVLKIREIKNRPDTPLSVWVPSLKWIKENCELTIEQLSEITHKLPGPYTFIVTLKNENSIAKNIKPLHGTLGIRMPNNYLHNFFEELAIPIVTTSANKHGKNFMTELDNLDDDIKAKTDFLIFDGALKQRPSKIINLVTKEVIER